ncbi:TPA: BspA family leucine-rich repeat surface protein, partial [Enterococcus faecalis]|nr:BspA family leucine-rich repeat surface protein [Enterococcus faecalis]
ASNKTCFSMFRDCSNLVNIDNNQLNWYNLNNVSDLSWLFFGCTGLTSLTLNNFSSIPLLTNTSKMFQNCTNISNLDLNNFDTSKVENMSSMFNNCKSLTNLNLNSFNTENVTNMGYMFANCSNLTKLNLQNFKSKNIQYTDHMFLETSKLNYIDLSNFNMTSTINKQNMFFTTSETPLIVLTNDTFLLNYQYSEDHRFPTGPVFDANGGKFDNQQTTKTYFESCAISPQDSKLQLTTFQQFKQDLKPTRDSYLFESWNLTEGNEPTSNTDLFNSATYTAQWTPSLVNGNIPSQDVDNVKPGTTSIYGIAYMPKAFTIPSTKLTDETTQTIPINLTNSYHVAVRDQR